VVPLEEARVLHTSYVRQLVDVEAGDLRARRPGGGARASAPGATVIVGSSFFA